MRLFLFLLILASGCQMATQRPRHEPISSSWPQFQPEGRRPAAELLRDIVTWAATATRNDDPESGAARVERLARACLRADHQELHSCGPADDAEHYRYVEIAWERVAAAMWEQGGVPPASDRCWDDGRPCGECLASVGPVSAAACLDHTVRVTAR